MIFAVLELWLLQLREIDSAFVYARPLTDIGLNVMASVCALNLLIKLHLRDSGSDEADG